MQGIIIKIWIVFIWIFALTGLMTLIGVGVLWTSNIFHKPISDLPYLHFLMFALIAELLSCIFAMAKYGFKYLPQIEIKKSQEATLQFMKKFIRNASTVTIISNRISWIDDAFISEVKIKKNEGIKIKIIIPKQQDTDIPKITALKEILENDLLITQEKEAPEARFTLLNSGRSGAERLAIAKGVYPQHEITIFDNYSGPQIIGMAKDIIRKSEEIANAT